jgi:hypothetical protein
MIIEEVTGIDLVPVKTTATRLFVTDSNYSVTFSNQVVNGIGATYTDFYLLLNNGYDLSNNANQMDVVETLLNLAGDVTRAASGFSFKNKVWKVTDTYTQPTGTGDIPGLTKSLIYEIQYGVNEVAPGPQLYQKTLDINYGTGINFGTYGILISFEDIEPPGNDPGSTGDNFIIDISAFPAAFYLNT